MKFEKPRESNSCPTCGCGDLSKTDRFKTSAPVRNYYSRRQVWACGHQNYQTWIQEYGRAVEPTEKEMADLTQRRDTFKEVTK